MQLLKNRIAVVAGATRGAGRGIAVCLGEAGATVYCTGRSVTGQGATVGRSETINETAALVATRGGTGIAVQVDHTVEAQVRGLFERIAAEQGRLDLLVNDIWGGDALSEWGTPFWELSPEKGLLMQQRAVHSHIITARYAAPLMVRQGHGLIIEITDGETLDYRGNLFYDLAKVSNIRLAYAMAEELRPHGVTALALTPGFLQVRGHARSFRRDRGDVAGGDCAGPALRRFRNTDLHRPRGGRAGVRPGCGGQVGRGLEHVAAGEGVWLR